MEKLVGILEGKLDLARFDELTQELKHSQHFVDRGEFQRLSSALLKKAERDDVEELYKSLQTSKTDIDRRMIALEKDFDKHTGNNQREIEAVKASVV